MKNIFLILLLCTLSATAATYSGRVVDDKGEPLMYATIYLQDSPEIGTATNTDGVFTLDINLPIINHQSSIINISCLGFETQQLPLSHFAQDTITIQLAEQPIWIAPTFVEAEKTRQSKRKKMATLLKAVYDRLEEESPKAPVFFGVVSDVKMEANASAWGMEQMIAKVVQIPSEDVTKMDSIQFVGTYCKRYCNPLVRAHVDSLMRHETDKHRKRYATAIDSGTIVHRKMWELSQMDKSVLLDLSDELGRWQSSRPDEQHLILTYTRKRSHLLGIIKTIETYHLLVDNSASLQTFASDFVVKLSLPFSIKMKDADLSWVNLLNMDEEQLQKFRLKKGVMHVQFETKYQLQNGLRLPIEKTMHVDAQLEDNKGNQLPCELQAKQQITHTKTQGVQPFPRYNKSQTVPRQLVPIY